MGVTAGQLPPDLGTLCPKAVELRQNLLIKRQRKAPQGLKVSAGLNFASIQLFRIRISSFIRRIGILD